MLKQFAEKGRLSWLPNFKYVADGGNLSSMLIRNYYNALNGIFKCKMKLILIFFWKAVVLNFD